jgi:hypothetical protein
MDAKTKTILIPILVLQFGLLFAANRFFVSDMNEDVASMKQELIVEGMPEVQARTIAYAMSNMRSNVSSYVWSTALFVIGLNGVLIRFAFAGKQKQENP